MSMNDSGCDLTRFSLHKPQRARFRLQDMLCQPLLWAKALNIFLTASKEHILLTCVQHMHQYVSQCKTYTYLKYFGVSHSLLCLFGSLFGLGEIFFGGEYHQKPLSWSHKWVVSQFDKSCSSVNTAGTHSFTDYPEQYRKLSRNR